MKKLSLPLSIIMALSAVACSPGERQDTNSKNIDNQNVTGNENVSVIVSNSPAGAAIPQLISLPASSLGGDEAVGKKIVNFPSEWTIDGQGKDILNVLVTLNPGETLPLILSDDGESAPDVVYAELSIRQNGEWNGTAYEAEGFDFENVESFTAPEQLTDHSYYLRYEGPGWENDLMGYRLYLDWRNGTDIFVKTGRTPVLHQVGQDGYSSYHELNDWGGDALKVGKSLGLGSFGRLEGDTVMHLQNVDEMSWNLGNDNKLSADFYVHYQGWNANNKVVDVTANYAIHAGDPTTTVNMDLSVPVDDLVTGVVKHENVNHIELEMDGWGVIATYGKQSLLGEDDELGMALFYEVDDISGKFEGEHDYLIQFKPAKSVSYQFMAVWPKHPDSPKDEDGFVALLKAKLKSLAHPVTTE